MSDDPVEPQPKNEDNAKAEWAWMIGGCLLTILIINSSPGADYYLIGTSENNIRVCGETVPIPLADQKYSGKLTLQLAPEQHRPLALPAAEAEVSLNRYFASQLN